ncbi:hypothetical protein [Sorangium sp. So ce1182]|uniref:hypothetical protein n=1 Tax=Sorangium sp. So ce1182 TaxID=3133334 RepID=UPI003F610C00
MADLDAISDRTSVAAGADFAFVITRRGRLVTRGAPCDMPTEGRGRIVEAALRLGSRGRLGHVELPREHLVPYGGAAPVDVYFGVAGEAILCAVMPTWADRQGVLPALEHGLRAIDERTPAESRPARKGHRRAPSRPRMEAAPSSTRRPVVEVREPLPSTGAVAAFREPPPSTGAVAAFREPPLPPSRRAAPPSLPPSRRAAPPPLPPSRRAAPPSLPAVRRSAVAGLVLLANGGPPRAQARPATLHDAPPPAAASPRPSASLPDLRAGEVTLGRERLAAVEREPGGPRRSLPEIRVGLARVGHETLAAIEAELQRPARPGSMPDALRLELVSISRESLLEIAAEEALQATAGPRPSMPLVRPERLTRPWVEAPEDARRMAEAEKRARKTAPPELDIELVAPETEVIDAAPAGRRARSG